MQTQYQPPEKVPRELDVLLATAFMCRDGNITAGKDSFLLNSFIESIPTSPDRWICKRPGIEQFTTFNGGGAAVSQGLWYHNGFILAASGNNLTRIVSPTSSGYTTGAAWTNSFNATWKAREYHATAVFNGALFVIGGRDNAGNALADVWSSEDGQNWQQLVSGAPWGARFKMQAVVFNNRLYVIGGNSTAGVPYNDVWVTDDGVNWTLVTGNAGWSPRYGPACVVYNNGIWILGGNNGAANLNDVWFSTDGSNWVQMINVAAWSIRSEHKAVVFNNRIYILGGFAAGAGGREVWYSSDGITWTMATNTAFASTLYAFGCTVYNGAIWVACGFEIAVGNKDDIWSSTDGATWNLVTGAFGGTARLGVSLDVFRAPPTVSSINAPILYLMGGSDSTPTYYNQIWYANVDGSLNTTYSIISTAASPERMQAAPMGFNKYFAIKDTAGMYVWFANEVRNVVNKNYPPITVPGVANLDETLYVMSPDAIIFGSAIGDPFEWPSRNFIGADYLSDGGAALTRYGNYILGFGINSLQLFYNSGAPSATLLRPVKTANTNVGCAYPYTVIEFETTVLWVGRTENNQRSVYLMNGMQPMVISTPWIDMAINQPWCDGSETAVATSVKIKGHPFYILTIPGLLYSFVYDLSNKVWYVWNSAISGLGWPCNFYATDGVEDYTLRDDQRIIYTWSPNAFMDGADVIPSKIQTENIDNGTDAMKACSEVVIEGDKINGCSFSLQFSDDDYQTWSVAETLDMDQDYVRVNRLGQYRTRAWLLSHSVNTGFRIKHMRPKIRIGNT